jgi:hypothetical protein
MVSEEISEQGYGTDPHETPGRLLEPDCPSSSFGAAPAYIRLAVYRAAAMSSVQDFDEFVDLIRARLGAADALKPGGEAHPFKSLFKPEEVDAIPENWWSDAFDELEAQGHLHPGSGRAMGIGNVHARLSADGRLHLRRVADET